ncbi:MAG: hypothetical protein KAH17_05100 [Bacteroidales bacterium]|nr:hypothetical protein [Bacteroidales bacterium]
MSKKIHLVIIVLFLILANLVLVFQYRNTIRKAQMKAGKENIILRKTLADAELSTLAWASSVSIPQRKIQTEYLDVLPPNGVLVVRLSDKQCSTCIDQLIFEIRKHLTDIGPDNLIVMYSSKRDHHINQQFRLRLLDPVKFISIPDSLELTPLDQFRIPYLFLINGAGDVQASFLPFPATTKYTSIFLKHIANQFNKSYEN